MTMFSVGILYSAQEFLALVSSTAGIDLRFPEVISTFAVASPKAILEVAQRCEWVQLNTSGHLEITERGIQIVKTQEAELALRVQIGHLIESYLPPWIPLLARGRGEAKKYLPLDAVQCLREAGLFNGISDDVVSWWDRYSKVSRKLGRDNNLEVGRRGEKLSLRHERERTKREPVWQGLESNLAGFDILSVVGEEDTTPLRIEVKASNSTPEVALFHITKNEWEVAMTSTNYVFHLWSLLPKPKLTEIEVEQVLRHVPLNQGKGLWQNVSIPYSVFWVEEFE